MEPDPIAKIALEKLNARGLTICDLAEMTDLHRSTLGRWLSGARSIRIRQALRVMRVLGIVCVDEDSLGETRQGSRIDRPRPAPARRRHR